MSGTIVMMMMTLTIITTGTTDTTGGITGVMAMTMTIMMTEEKRDTIREGKRKNQSWICLVTFLINGQNPAITRMRYAGFLLLNQVQFPQTLCDTVFIV